MKKRMTGRMTLLLAAAMCLTACGKKPDAVGDDYERLTDAAQESVSDTSRHVVFDVWDKTGVCRLSADVDIELNGYPNANVYELAYIVPDDTYIKDIAGRLFDDGAYTVEKPYAICDYGELEAEKERLETLLAEAYREDVDYKIESLDSLLYYYDYYEDNHIDLKPEEGFVFVDIPSLEEGKEDVRRKECRIRGRISGKDYELTCAVYNIGSYSLIRVQPLTPTAYAPKHFALDEDSIPEENVCDRGKADATVSLLLSKLGYSDFEPCMTGDCFTGTYREGNVLPTVFKDGYFYSCYRTFDGVKIDEHGYMMRAENFDEAMQIMNSGMDYQEAQKQVQENYDNAPYEGLSVAVDSEGIKYILIAVSYETKGVKVENVNMITVEQAVDAIKNYWSMHEYSAYADGDALEVCIKSFSFSYVVVNYGGNYSVVPAWTLTYMAGDNNGSNRDGASMRMAVNALDGEILRYAGW